MVYSPYISSFYVGKRWLICHTRSIGILLRRNLLEQTTLSVGPTNPLPLGLLRCAGPLGVHHRAASFEQGRPKMGEILVAIFSPRTIEFVTL